MDADVGRVHTADLGHKLRVALGPISSRSGSARRAARARSVDGAIGSTLQIGLILSLSKDDPVGLTVLVECPRSSPEPAVEIRLGKIRRRLPQDLVGPTEFTVLPP